METARTPITTAPTIPITAIILSAIGLSVVEEIKAGAVAVVEDAIAEPEDKPATRTDNARTLTLTLSRTDR